MAPQGILILQGSKVSVTVYHFRTEIGHSLVLNVFFKASLAWCTRFFLGVWEPLTSQRSGVRRLEWQNRR